MVKPVKADFQVRNEGLPERCEVCHQADRFDRQTGKCGRCRDLVFSLETFPWDSLRGLHLLNLDFPPACKQLLLNALLPTEQVLWVGRKYTFSPEAKFRRFIIGLVGVIFFAAMGRNFDLDGFAVIGLFICLLFFLSGFASDDCGLPVPGVLYVLTNRRAIIMRETPILQIESFWQAEIQELRSGNKTLDGSGFVYLNEQNDGFEGILNPHFVSNLIQEHLLTNQTAAN